MVKILRFIVVILGVVTVFVTAIFIAIVWKNFDLVGNGNISWENTSHVADFFGGVVGTLLSAMGFILIYLSFNSQTESQNDQKKQFLESQIENRFIELIKIHKETVSELHYYRGVDLKGQKVIDFIVNQFECCFKEIAPFFENTEPSHYYKSSTLADINKIAAPRAIDVIQLAHIDIAYSIIFFGMSVGDIKALENLLKRHYNNDLVKDVLSFIKLKCLGEDNPENWEIIQNKKLKAGEIHEILDQFERTKTVTKSQFDTDYQNAFESLLKKTKTDKYYGGHQYKLGHYFRHLFMTVKYINDQDSIKYESKYNYIKMLRAQISTIEQYLIFYNSLSFMGRAWELEHLSANPTDKVRNRWLFTKYNLIKNTPNLIQLETVKLDTYYPDIHFEFNSAPAQRAELLKIYI